MNPFHRPLLLSCLLSCLLAAGASATAAPRHQHRQQPQRPPSPCALVLQQPSGDPQPLPAQLAPPPARKVNMDFLYDPCKLTDTDKDSDIANNEGEPPHDQIEQTEDWVEWNRQQASNNGIALWLPMMDMGLVTPAQASGRNDDAWWQRPLSTSRQGQQHRDFLWSPLPAAGLAPAVPEPGQYLLWLAGLPVLAAGLWRRRQHAVLSGDTALPAARR